jgi:hypothetical protein
VTGCVITVSAQQPQSMRRIAVFSYQSADDPEAQLYIAAFLKRLQELGWTVGRNMQIDYRWTGSNADRIAKYTIDLVALSPEVVLTAGRHACGGPPAGEPNVANRLRASRRCSRRRICQQPFPAGRQRYRVHKLRLQFQHKVVGVIEANSPAHFARRSASLLARADEVIE